MRKLVVALVVTFAIFTFIRDFPSNRADNDPKKTTMRAALIP
jgi:hypothetical protein